METWNTRTILESGPVIAQADFVALNTLDTFSSGTEISWVGLVTLYTNTERAGQL